VPWDSVDKPRDEDDADFRLELTPYDVRLIQLLAAGLTEKEAAQALASTPFAVKNLTKQLRRRLGAKNCAHMVALTVRKGYIPREQIGAASAADLRRVPHRSAA
jgi:DNA-binding CsgD family transcriptional regulator